MSKEFAVVISPHIDDAVISLGGILQGYDNVLVLNVFDQSRETITGTRPEEVTKQRRNEDEKISQLYNFKFNYASLPDTSLRGVNWNDYKAPIDYALLSKTQNWIKSQLDVLSVNFNVFIPASYGLHPDHYLTTIAFSTEPLLSYLNRVPFAVYCDQPYYLDNKLVLYKHCGHEYLNEAGSLTVVPFSSEEKRKMLFVYQSQLSEDRINFLAKKNTNEFYWQTDPQFFIKSLIRNKND
jgi:LmbE family N-acetylglucosaminyl deacetylase